MNARTNQALSGGSLRAVPIEKRIELWAELVEENTALLLSGLSAKVGPEGDLSAELRRWSARHQEERCRQLAQFAEDLMRREAEYAARKAAENSVTP